ncbi:hypothetical protein V8C35DRAFT_283387 [Trichoderma chlorosporum]
MMHKRPGWAMAQSHSQHVVKSAAANSRACGHGSQQKVTLTLIYDQRTQKPKPFAHHQKMPAAALIASHNFASASSSDSDVPSSRMDSNPRPIASVLVLRCMRCARSAETTTTDDASTAGMVRISHNLYYCERCAKLVGYK